MIERRPATDGLKALIATLTGKPVGLGTLPVDPATGKPVPPPYTILDSLDRADDDHTLADDGKAVVLTYQATYVSGPDPQQTDSRGRRAIPSVLRRRGWKVVERPADDATGYVHALNVGAGQTCWHREAREAGGTPDPNDGIITRVIRYKLYLEKTA